MNTPTPTPSPPVLRALPQFPDSVLHPGRLRWRQRVRVLAIVIGVGAVAAGATLITRRVAADDGLTLRTGIASSQTVSETYNAVAAIEPVTRSQVAFPVGGTVNAVNVTVGDTVQIGDALATIDTTELEQALRQAESTLASAQLTLNVALSGEDPSTAGGGSLGGGTVMGAAFSGDAVFEYAPTNPDGYSYQLVAINEDELAAARQAIVAAQSAVTSATNTVASARDSAISICAALDVTVDPDDPEGSVAAINANLGACQTAIDQLIAAQDNVTAAQDALAIAADAYDTLLNTWAAELEDSTTTPESTTTSPESTTSTTENPSTTTTGDGPTGGGPTGGGGAIPSGGGSGGNSTAETREPTSAELIAYQADYAAALHAVEAAQQALTQATIVSPIGGTVVSVGLTTGDSVSAASDTQAVIIEGAGGYEATLSVSVDDIDQIAVGQQAQLTPDGGATPETGEVVGISQVPDTSGGTANYRVTVALTSQGAELTSGNVGDVGIVVASGTDVVAVPTSAVTPTANGYTVDIIDDSGTVQTVQVQVGAKGPEWTEILSSLEVGQTVVLADLSEPLPGSATDVSSTQTNTVVFPGGGVPVGGGGFPGGGFPGGG